MNSGKRKKHQHLPTKTLKVFIDENKSERNYVFMNGKTEMNE